MKLLPLLIFTLSLSLLAASAQTAGGYHVTKKIPIAGEGSWDYLTIDEAARRLYVSHGTQVEVLDVDSGAIVGKIANTPGVHGIAIAPNLGRGFVSNGQSSTVTIFDLKTLKTIADVPTGKKPDAIIYDPATSRVLAFNGGSNSATAIQAADGKVAGTVDLGGGPEFAVADAIIALDIKQVGEREMRVLQILKLRGSSFRIEDFRRRRRGNPRPPPRGSNSPHRPGWSLASWLAHEQERAAEAPRSFLPAAAPY